MYVSAIIKYSVDGSLSQKKDIDLQYCWDTIWLTNIGKEFFRAYVDNDMRTKLKSNVMRSPIAIYKMLSYVASTLLGNLITVVPSVPTSEHYTEAYIYTWVYDDEDAIIDIVGNVPVSVFSDDAVGHTMRARNNSRKIILTRLNDAQLTEVFDTVLNSIFTYPVTLAYCVERLGIGLNRIPPIYPYASLLQLELTDIEYDDKDWSNEPVDMDYLLSLLDPNNVPASVKLIERLLSNNETTQELVNWIENYCADVISDTILIDVINRGLTYYINFSKCYNIAKRLEGTSLSYILSLINGTITVSDIEKLDSSIIDEVISRARNLRNSLSNSTRICARNILDELF